MALLMMGFNNDGENDEKECDDSDDDIGYGQFANVVLVYCNQRVHISVFCSCGVWYLV